MNFVEGARRGYVPRICLSQASYSTDARTHSPQLLYCAAGLLQIVMLKGRCPLHDHHDIF
eukprot:2109183-Prorocentrum_lima.AAC.1